VHILNARHVNFWSFMRIRLFLVHSSNALSFSKLDQLVSNR
jgi:hypothetical protein